MLRLGRLPPKHTAYTFRAGLVLAAAVAPLGKPPDVSDDWTRAVKVPWGMYGNDRLGDCVMADTAHQIILHTANAGTVFVPDEHEVERVYFQLTGGQDVGLNETDVCQYLITTGLCGQKSAGTAMIDPANLDHIRWCVQLFGACRLGINVTQNLQTDFSQGAPWTRLIDPVEGGHDVPIVRYDRDYAYCVTWGGIQAIAWSLMAQPAFLEESHAEVWCDFCAASGACPNGFNLLQLLADLPALEMPQAA